MQTTETGQFDGQPTTASPAAPSSVARASSSSSRSRASADASPLDALPPPPRVFVPIHSIDGESGALKVAGARVARAEPLVESPSGAAYVPVSPVDGRIVGRTQSTL